MILKHPDDKQKDKDILQALMKEPGVSPKVQRLIEQQIRNIDAGARAEAEAAYQMKVLYDGGVNHVVIHDLRLVFRGLVAQIDHLVINRLMDIWVCESKNFSEGVSINEQGEFTAFFGGKPYGIPSPIEQNNNHIMILNRLFNSGTFPLPKRMGMTLKPNLRSVVLVSKNARISRSKTPVVGQEVVIKNDAMEKVFHGDDLGDAMKLVKAVSSETIMSIGKELVRFHQPLEFDWRAKFGLGSEAPAEPVPVPAIKAPIVEAVPIAKAAAKLCVTCQKPVSQAVYDYCVASPQKFQQGIYCMPCQKLVTKKR